MPTTPSCPSAETLKQLLRGELPADQANSIKQHIPACRPCTATVEALEPLLAQTIAAAQPPGREGPVPAAHRHVNASAWRGGAGEEFPLPGPAQSPDELGRLGGYRVLKVLGEGAMGVVFHAEDLVLGRPVALKVMQPRAAADPCGRERFLREAKAAAAVEHDHIVTILHVGEDHGMPFLVMPLLRGESLEDRIWHEGRLGATEVLRIGREIAQGLSAAHRQGLIHRDVKPANIWLEGESGRVKLLDFGLARIAQEPAQLTQQGVVMGTPYYMAPEQSRSLPLDGRADLFSLGCVLYRIATGRLPFPGDNALAVLTSLALEAPPPPHQLAPDLPPRLSDLILRLMAKDRADRPESADAVVEAIRRLEKEPAAVAAPASPDPPSAPVRPRRRWLRTAAVLMLLGVLTAAAVGRMLGRGGPRAEGPTAVVQTPGADHPRQDLPAAEAQGGELEAVRALWHRQAGTPAGVQAARQLRQMPSLLDQLQPQETTGEHPHLEGLAGVLQGHKGAAGPVAFSPDGRTLASGGGEQDQTICLWDLGGRTPRLRFHSEPLGNAVRMLAFSPDGATLAASAWDAGTYLWDVRADTRRPDQVIRRPGIRFTSVALVAGAERTVAAGTDRGSVWLWGSQPGSLAEQELQSEGLGIVNGVAFAPATSTLAAAGPGVILWDLQAKERPPRRLSGAEQAEVRGLAFSPDGSLLAAGFDNGAIRLWVAAREFAAGPQLRRHTDQVWSVAFSPDGRTLASGGWDGRVILWDATEGTRLREWLLPGEHVHRVSFAPDSRHLAFGTDGGTYVLRLSPPE
jgi:WD40 repeat protein